FQKHLLICLLTHSSVSDLQRCFNFNVKNFKIFSGSKEAQFGYTVQQHEAGGRAWLLVGAPLEFTEGQQTGDVYRCPLDHRNSADCSRLKLGKVSLDNVSERKEQMRLGLTLISNPKDNSFVTCGPLWSHECGSSLYSTGLCTRANRNFKATHTFAPALQRCETFMDIVIVLDGSNSIYPWYEVQDFITNVLHKFHIGPDQTQVGVVQYGSTVVHEFSLGEYQTVDTVVEAVRNIDQRGGYETRTALAINVARSKAFQRGGRPGAQKVMIVITDGESHDSLELVDAVNNSKNDNITMYAIAVLGYYNRRGIDPKAFLEEIKFIATDPDEKHLFKVTEESALKEIVDALGERIFSLEGTSTKGQGFGLQMAQAGFSSHLVKRQYTVQLFPCQGVFYSLVFDERRPSPRALMDDPQQLLAIPLQTGGQMCDRLSFTVQETADYWRPIVVVMETRLQNQDDGPVLDPDWPSSWRTELHFWNGCEQEENCAPDLILNSRTDLKNAQGQTAYSFCEQDDPLFVVESGRRRMVVFARLENQGENAYRAAIHISTSPNLLFSSLLVKGQSDIQIECSTTNVTAAWRSCNISNPFMKSLSQVGSNYQHNYILAALSSQCNYKPNRSNSVSIVVLCMLSVPASAQVTVTLMGRLQLSLLHAVSFKSLELLGAASVYLEASSPMVLQEDKPVRQVPLCASPDSQRTVLSQPHLKAALKV
uniref:Integrin, alpha 11b n=1 Tax=Oryzias sinensis TaxID=183150 RepID=A0A8C7WWD3_9TELE